MKKIIVLFAVIITISCSKDDQKSTPTENSILGKWYYKETVANDVVIPYTDHEPCGKDYIEFYDTNKIRGIDVWDCEEDLDWMGTFTKSSNSLTIFNGTNGRTVEIFELNSTTLSYKFAYDKDGDGVNENYIERFTRQ